MNLWEMLVPLRASARFTVEPQPDAWDLKVQRTGSDGSKRLMAEARLRYTEDRHETTVQFAALSRELTDEELEKIDLERIEHESEALLYARVRAAAVAAAAVLEEGIDPPRTPPSAGEHHPQE